MSTGNLKAMMTGDLDEECFALTQPTQIDAKMPGTGSLDESVLPRSAPTDLQITVNVHDPKKVVVLTVDTAEMREREAIRDWNEKER